jgi:hypothetical protein
VEPLALELDGEVEELELDEGTTRALVAVGDDGVPRIGAFDEPAIEPRKTMPIEDGDVLEIEPCATAAPAVPSSPATTTTVVGGQLPPELLALARRSSPPAAPTATLIGGKLPDELLARARRSNPPARPPRPKGPPRSR